MRFERLFTKLFCQPVLLESSARIGFEMALLGLMNGDSLPPGISASFDLRKQSPDSMKKRTDGLLEIQGDTAIIHIDGAIDKHLSAFEAWCYDATDLNDVDRALAQAASNNEIANVLLAINSPGGSLTGVPETADRIADLAKDKNVFAFTDAQCCSAAYWLASACDQVFATSSAQVGSIGVYLALMDQSRRLEDMGIKIETIKDGKLKAAGAQWKTLTDEEKDHFQQTIYDIGTMFRAAVTAKRPQVSIDTMQGQSFIGQKALDAGLVDSLVKDKDAAIAQF